MAPQLWTRVRKRLLNSYNKLVSNISLRISRLVHVRHCISKRCWRLARDCGDDTGPETMCDARCETVTLPTDRPAPACCPPPRTRTPGIFLSRSNVSAGCSFVALLRLVYRNSLQPKIYNIQIIAFDHEVAPFSTRYYLRAIESSWIPLRGIQLFVRQCHWFHLFRVSSSKVKLFHCKTGSMMASHS